MLALAVVPALPGCGQERREISSLWDELRGTGDPTLFSPDMVADLPEPARRFLSRAIAPGTSLATSVEVEMHGYTIARHVRAGWNLGEPDEFRFFSATVDQAAFLPSRS